MKKKEKSILEKKRTLVKVKASSTTYSLKINRRLAHLLCLAFISLPVFGDSTYLLRLFPSLSEASSADNQVINSDFP